MSKKNIVALCAAAAVFLALMCTATFLDLEISLAIGAKESVFGQFFDKVGELPAYIFVAVAALIICQAVRKTNKFYKWLKPLTLLITYAGFFLLVWRFAEEFFAETKWVYLYIAVFAFVLCAAAVLLTARIDKDVMEKLLFFAATAAFAVLIAESVGLALNALWSRQRFRNIGAANYPGGESTGFTPWYKPTLGKHAADELFISAEGEADDAYNSFPNAQTLASASLLALTVLPDLFGKLRKYRIWFWIVPAVLIVMTMIANVISESAYLSDVTMGAAIGSLSVCAAKAIAKAVLKRDRLIRKALESAQK